MLNETQGVGDRVTVVKEETTRPATGCRRSVSVPLTSGARWDRCCFCVVVAKASVGDCCRGGGERDMITVRG